MGYILIKGEELELIKLDTSGGNIYIKGKIDSIMYLDESKKKNKESLITRLFK
jgi:sporulation protein YabP